MRKAFLLIFVFFVRSFFLLASDGGKVLSPVSGEWANKQCLFVDLKEGEECYYSLSGSDPLESGFVYDGPVLLDVSGKVRLRVTVLGAADFSGGKKYEYDISYFVREFGGAGSTADFVNDSVSKGIVSVNTAKPLDIPGELTYSFWDEEPSQKGRTILVRRANNLSRYVPCTVSDGNHLWRFLVYVSGIEIDPDFKEASSGAEKRGGVATAISVAGADGGNEPLTFSPVRTSGGDSFSVRLLSSGIRGESVRRTLHKDFSIDALDGEEISGEAFFEVFCGEESVGVSKVPFRIDRKKPLKPDFIPAFSGKTPCGKAEIFVNSKEKAEIFFAAERQDGGLELGGSEAFRKISPDEKIVLRPVGNEITKYKVFAYAKDAAGNKSEISEYNVSIDPFTYYFVEKSGKENGNGSRESPFTKAAQVIEAAKKSQDARFFVDGTLRFPEGKVLMSGKCSFSGTPYSKIIIPGNGFVSISGANISFDGFVIEKESGSSEKMFVMEKSSVSLENCEIVGKFDFNAVAFLMSDCEFSLSGSGLTVQGTGYSCPVIAERSAIEVSSSRISSIGETAVCFSVDGGSFSMDGSKCRSIARFGRIAELVSSTAALKENAFLCDFEIKPKNMSAVWTGKKETDSFLGATLFR